MRKRAEVGSVLLSVIWTLSMLAIYTVSVNHKASQELFFGRWYKERILTRAMAQSAVERALYELQQDEFITFDALNESWASNEKAFKNIPLGEGVSEVLCSTNQETDLLNAENIRYGICDEAARINLNTAPEAVLKNLMMAVQQELNESAATEIAQAIVDWRDGDDAELPSGAEKKYYERLSQPYAAHNAPLETVEELMMIKGITLELFNLLRPFVTVYTDGHVNMNTASVTVMQGLGMKRELALKIEEFRKGADLIEGTEDDQVFQDPGQISAAISAAGSFSGEEFAQVANPISQGQIAVKSDVFRIHAVGRINKDTRNINSVITCVVKRDGTILSWREGN